jgi:hypothetical protein
MSADVDEKAAYERSLRMWALEQVIMHHDGSGVVVSKLTAEADDLVAWVKKEQE